MAKNRYSQKNGSLVSTESQICYIHITTLCKVANKTLGFATVAFTFNNAFVRSRLEYCPAIWDPYEDTVSWWKKLKECLRDICCSLFAYFYTE